MTTLNSEHPDYVANKADWVMLRDAFKGERAVKDKTIEYLPALRSHLLDGMGKSEVGWQTYQSYLTRAVFPDFYTIGVETLVGILNAKETTVKLPAKLEYLRDKATNKGEDLNSLIRRIHTQQLISGRLGLLADLPSDPGPEPQLYIATYIAEAIINWDDAGENVPANLNLVVLDESNNKREGMAWSTNDRFRVLALGDYKINETEGSAATYQFGVFEGSNATFDQSQMKPAMIRGRTSKQIPFTFINSKDCLAEPDVPPLLGLGRLCFTIYRGEADYRYALYMQGQDTLVVVGGVIDTNAKPGQAVRIGAGARIDVNLGGDAKYIGVSATGLPEMRSSLENDRQQAAVRTGQLLAPGKMSLESGEALKTRVAAQTATLTSVAISAANGLKRLLRIMAEWVGANPDEVDVLPNLDFTNAAIEGQDIVQLITAKNLGYPISYESLHMIARARGLMNTTFQEEMDLIKNDPKLLMERAEKMAIGLKGNNPLEAAGGPTAKPQVKGPQKGNQQTK